MEIRRSISYPQLMVSNLGDVYLYDSGKRINIIRDHSYSTEFPSVKYWPERNGWYLSKLNGWMHD